MIISPVRMFHHQALHQPRQRLSRVVWKASPWRSFGRGRGLVVREKLELRLRYSAWHWPTSETRVQSPMLRHRVMVSRKYPLKTGIANRLREGPQSVQAHMCPICLAAARTCCLAKHPYGGLQRPIRPVASELALKHRIAELVDHLIDTNRSAKPGVPSINDLAPIDSVGVLAFSCTTPSGRTAPRDTARPRQKPSSKWTRGQQCIDIYSGPLVGRTPEHRVAIVARSSKPEVKVKVISPTRVVQMDR